MNNEIITWDAFKGFAGAYALPIMYVEYGNKYDIAVYVSGVRHFYVMHKSDTVDVAELLSMEEL